jgi:hypothetical protein
MNPAETELRSGELLISVTTSGGVTRFEWRGTSDASDPGREITPFLTATADKGEGQAFELDFRHLEYMNSATVAPIVHFIRLLDGRGIAVKLIFDVGVGWQRVNFVAMKSMARALRYLTVEG